MRRGYRRARCKSAAADFGCLAVGPSAVAAVASRGGGRGGPPTAGFGSGLGDDAPALLRGYDRPILADDWRAGGGRGSGASKSSLQPNAPRPLADDWRAGGGFGFWRIAVYVPVERAKRPPRSDSRRDWRVRRPSAAPPPAVHTAGRCYRLDPARNSPAAGATGLVVAPASEQLPCRSTRAGFHSHVVPAETVPCPASHCSSST